MTGHDGSREDFRRALEALRSGVPNRDAVRVLGCSQQEVVERFRTQLAAVDELAAKAGGDADQLTLRERLLLALDADRQLALEDEVDLLLPPVPVDAAALARGEDDLVDPEGADAELGAQAVEPLGRLAAEARPRDALLHRQSRVRPVIRS